jgi:hypothetical protein
MAVDACPTRIPWVDGACVVGHGVDAADGAIRPSPFEGGFAMLDEQKINRFNTSAVLVDDHKSFANAAEAAASLTGNASWGFGAVSVSAEVGFLKREAARVNTVSYCVTASVEIASQLVDLRSLRLTTAAEALLVGPNGSDAFRASYGVGFISGFVVGGTYTGSIAHEAKDGAEFEQVPVRALRQLRAWPWDPGPVYMQAKGRAEPRGGLTLTRARARARPRHMPACVTTSAPHGTARNVRAHRPAFRWAPRFSTSRPTSPSARNVAPKRRPSTPRLGEPAGHRASASPSFTRRPTTRPS